VNYRILYCFYGQGVALLVAGITKEDKVPEQEIERAVRRRRAFEIDPGGHAADVEF